MPWVMNTTSREERCAKADVGDLSCVPRVSDLLRAFYPPIPNKPGKPSLGSRELANPPLSSPPAYMEYTVRTLASNGSTPQGF